MQDEYGDTALMVACAADHVMVAAVLIEKGALVNYKNKVSLLWLSYMHTGVRYLLLLFQHVHVNKHAWKKDFLYLLSDHCSDHLPMLL